MVVENDRDNEADSVARFGSGCGNGAGAIDIAVVGGKVRIPVGGDVGDIDGDGYTFVKIVAAEDAVGVCRSNVMLLKLVVNSGVEGVGNESGRLSEMLSILDGLLPRLKG